MLKDFLRRPQKIITIATFRSLASSAPVLQFTGLTDCSVYSSIVTRTFKNAANNCDNVVRNSWIAIWNLTATGNKLSEGVLYLILRYCTSLCIEEGRDWMNKNFVLCNDSYIKNGDTDAWNFIFWIQYTYGNLAMMDYPYATNFTNPVPGWCVKVGTPKN